MDEYTDEIQIPVTLLLGRKEKKKYDLMFQINICTDCLVKEVAKSVVGQQKGF
jgi:hypothetical protein